MGKFLAGVHDLRLVQHTFGKDLHGMRERAVNHKAKQNFDAVLHITNDSVMTLLARITDAKGTTAYLSVIKCVVDSYLDKSLDWKRHGLLSSFCITGVTGYFKAPTTHLEAT